MAKTGTKEEIEAVFTKVPSDVVAAFVRDFTTYAHKVWGYELSTAAEMARNSADKRDVYFAMYSTGWAWRAFNGK